MRLNLLAMFAALANPAHISHFLGDRSGPNPPRRGAKWCVKHSGPGAAKSYFNRPGSGLLTKEEIARRRGGNPKGAY